MKKNNKCCPDDVVTWSSIRDVVFIGLVLFATIGFLHWGAKGLYSSGRREGCTLAVNAAVQHHNELARAHESEYKFWIVEMDATNEAIQRMQKACE